MDTANTNVNMSDSGGSTTVNTSSSINTSTTGESSSDTSVNTSSYQTSNTGDTTEVEEVDLSAEQEETLPTPQASTTSQIEQADSKEVKSKLGEFLDGVGNFFKSGAKVVSNVVSYIGGALKGIGKSLVETACNVASNVKSILAKVKEAWDAGPIAFLSTGAVVFTSIVSGVAKLGEHILLDGVAWAGGKVVKGATWLLGSMVGWFNEDAGDWIKDKGDQINQGIKGFVEVDWVGKANELIYERTGLGRFVNENSVIKYDSEEALGIRNFSEKVGVFVAATAATVLTGGAAAVALPLLLGFMYGSGKKAEQTYQEKGIETSAKDEWLIALSGAKGAVEWYAKGKMGANFLQSVHSIIATTTNPAFSLRRSALTWFRSAQNFGIKEGVKSAAHVATSGQTWALATLNSIPQALDVAEKAVETGELSSEDVGGVIASILKTAGIQVLTTGFFGGGMSAGANKYLASEQYIYDTAKVTGISQESAKKYIDSLESDIEWEAKKRSARDDYNKAMGDDKAWDKMNARDQSKYISAASPDDYIDGVRRRMYSTASDSMVETRYRTRKGYYTTSSVQEVMDYKLEGLAQRQKYNEGIRNPDPAVQAKAKQDWENYTKSIQKDYSGSAPTYGKNLPGADSIVSDKRVMEYTKQLFPDDPAVQAATNLEELGKAIEGKTVRFTTFQNAQTGAPNVVTFGSNYGPVGQPTQTGGPFAVPDTTLKTYADQYGDYCTYTSGEFKILREEQFGEEVLSGVPLSEANGTYIIQTEVPIGDVHIPSISNGSSYPAFFVEGGQTLSRTVEATIPAIAGVLIGQTGTTPSGIKWKAIHQPHIK